jgi:SNF2 family DNA or RNA helicase
VITLQGEDIVIPNSHAYATAELKELGARWSAKQNAWTLPATRANAKALNALALEDVPVSVGLPTPGEEPDDERLYGYQRAAAARLAGADHGQILVAKPGLGKTAMAITAADVAVPDDQVVVVAPASLLRTWEREIRVWSKDPRVYVMQGTVDYDQATAARWIICSWDKVPREAKTWGKGWPLFILDESVLAKSRGSQRFKALTKLRNGITRVWLLSGSPTTRHADDLWAQLHLVWPRAFGSYWRFAERYCIVEETPWGRKVSGTRRGRDAAADNDDLVIVINEEDAGLELPEYLFEPALEVALSGAQLKAYRDMAKTFIAELKDGTEVVAANEMGRLMKLQQIASCWDGESAKAQALVDVIDAYEPPYLIWTHWRESGQHVADLLSDKGLSVAHVDGGTKDRDAEIEAYKAGERDALVLSLGVGKFGHTLVNTKTVFYLDKSWNADDYFQSLHRVKRIGLKHRPVVVPVRATGTVDELVEDNLEGKLGSISRMTRGDLADLLKGLGR